MSDTTHRCLNHDGVPGDDVQSWDRNAHRSAPLQPNMTEQIPLQKKEAVEIQRKCQTEAEDHSAN